MQRTEWRDRWTVTRYHKRLHFVGVDSWVEKAKKTAAEKVVASPQSQDEWARVVLWLRLSVKFDFQHLN